MSAAVTIRTVDPASDADLHAFVAFQRDHGTPRHDVDQLRTWLRTIHDFELSAAVDDDGTTVGCATTNIPTPVWAATVMMNVFALDGRPDVVRALAANATSWSGATHATSLMVHATDPTEQHERDLLAAGFSREGERRVSRRDIVPDDLHMKIDVPEGVSVTSLAARPELADSMLEVWNEAFHDVPGPMSVGDVGLGDVRDEVLVARTDPWPDTFLIAVGPDDRVLGLAVIVPRPGGEYGHRFTGVRRSERGRGLAMALKCECIRIAAASNISWLHATNDEDNVAMRAINDQLGYRVMSRVVMYERIIDRSGNPTT